MTINPERFDSIFDTMVIDAKHVCVAVSGGPDSMALLHLLSTWATGKKIVNIHAVTVDHALRDNSAAEALVVGENVSSFPNVIHHILKREAPEQNTRVMERARADRYALISQYCTDYHITHIFVAHHMDDQAETFLFRLAKGSGLDGLAGMSPAQALRNDQVLYRPFLDISKADILSYCKAHNISYIHDPSNKDRKFARPRMRASLDVLKQEGLTHERLSVTAKRIARARQALEIVSEKQYQIHLNLLKPDRIVFDKSVFCDPDEIGIRILLRGMQYLHTQNNINNEYGPRLARVETLYNDLKYAPDFKRRTLSGLMFSKDEQGITITLEHDL